MTLPPIPISLVYRGLLPAAILLLMLQNLAAQENAAAPGGKFRARAGIYWGNSRVVDHYFSAIPYSGPSFSAMAAFQFTKRRSTHEVEWWISGVHAKAEGKPDQSMRQTYFKGTYNYWHTLTKPGASRFLFSAGGGVVFRDATRTYADFINNYQSYEFMAYLNALIRLSYQWGQNGRGLKLEDRVHLPVFGTVKQPELGGIEGSWKTLTWNSLQGAENELNIEKQFNQRHRISIEYRLDYYALHTLREVIHVQHSIGINYTYAFD